MTLNYILNIYTNCLTNDVYTIMYNNYCIYYDVA